mgnify:CR=1 FL=1
MVLRNSFIIFACFFRRVSNFLFFISLTKNMKKYIFSVHLTNTKKFSTERKHVHICIIWVILRPIAHILYLGYYPPGQILKWAEKKSFEKTYETFHYIQTGYGGFGFLVSFAIWVIGWPEMAKIVAKFVFFKDLTARSSLLTHELPTKDRAGKNTSSRKKMVMA